MQKGLEPLLMRKYRKVAAAVIVLVAFVFMARALYQNWSRVPFGDLEFRIEFLLISYLFQFAFFVLGGVGWTLVLRRLGVRFPFRRSIEIMSVAKLGRYLPGKVWAFLGQIYLAKRDSVPAHTATVSVLLSTVLSVLSALFLFLVSLIFLVNRGLPRGVYLSLLLIPICFIVLEPRVLSRTLNWLLKRLGRKEVQFSFGYLRMLEVLAVYCVNWICQGFCFFFLIRSFYPISLSHYLPLVGINSLAWTIGFLVFIVPGGLGVREGLQSLLLRLFLPFSVGVIAALLYRIWAIVGMLIFFAIFGRGLRKTLEEGVWNGISRSSTTGPAGERSLGDETCQCTVQAQVETG
jgi:uncharacterized membrane protein YbhN (UPF0104 family)